MPATRLRNEFWRRSLQQVYERGGALEIAVSAVAHDAPLRPQVPADHSDTEESPGGGNLIWRVRILSLTDHEIVVEAPATLGEHVPIARNIDLIAVLAIGQNRWMFSTQVIESTMFPLTSMRAVAALRLRMPENVERCQRRSFYRVSTMQLRMPKVDCWPLLDLNSATLAEKASELRFLNGQNRPAEANGPFSLPEVGPKFEGTLINVGGGGIGLLLEADSAKALARHRLFWLSIDLTPSLEGPIAVAAKLVHTHIDSTQRTYAGLAFEFSHHKEHQKFVVSQFCKYVTMQQQAQITQLREAS